MRKETEELGEEVSNKINLPPVKIELDHFMVSMINLSKKFYISNEVEFDKNGKMKIELHFKGVFYSRREHCLWAKDAYYNIAMLGMGRTHLDDEVLPKEERKIKAEELLWNEMMKLLTHCHNLIEVVEDGEKKIINDLTALQKVNQLGDGYKSESYPLNIFQKEEERKGRPIKPGTRFKYWYVKSKEKLAGYKIRQILDPDDVIDRFYYLDLIKTPITKLLEGMFQNGAIFKVFMDRIKLKQTMLEELVFDPEPRFPPGRIGRFYPGELRELRKNNKYIRF